tara:strand:- start:188 stop:403 length:216 start_codon:yes stop_codon:yes gene_type:complete
MTVTTNEKIKYLKKAFTLNNPPKLSKVYSKSEQGKKKKERELNKIKDYELFLKIKKNSKKSSPIPKGKNYR